MKLVCTFPVVINTFANRLIPLQGKGSTIADVVEQVLSAHASIKVDKGRRYSYFKVRHIQIRFQVFHAVVRDTIISQQHLFQIASGDRKLLHDRQLDSPDNKLLPSTVLLKSFSAQLHLKFEPSVV